MQPKGQDSGPVRIARPWLLANPFGEVTKMEILVVALLVAILTFLVTHSLVYTAIAGCIAAIFAILYYRRL